MLDPIVALTFIAAHTRTVRLGTGILLLPQFNPVIVAKQLASLDVLAEGRLTVGIGVGWSEHEYEVLGIPYHDRGSRADDYLKAMKALWSQDKPVYRGKFVSFDGLQANPRPVQQPNPPVVIGGLSEEAYRRAVRQGTDGSARGRTWKTPGADRRLARCCEQASASCRARGARGHRSPKGARRQGHRSAVLGARRPPVEPHPSTGRGREGCGEIHRDRG